MSTILQLAPQNVWKHFYSLTQIPRPSGHMEKITKFLIDFGKGLGLESFVDEVGNVIIRKPATPGMENRKGVILQAHMDMVPQKNNDTIHDFTTDPIETYVDGDWVKAKGTTLGADNGLGVAAIMAVLEDNNLKHGPLEALITKDEETGMYGAFGLKPGTMQGEILLNLDSEDEGELYIGCAGGLDITATLEYKEEMPMVDFVARKITLKGLRGGHSGLEINEGRGNANKLLARIVHDLLIEFDSQLASFEHARHDPLARFRQPRSRRRQLFRRPGRAVVLHGRFVGAAERHCAGRGRKPLRADGQHHARAARRYALARLRQPREHAEPCGLPGCRDVLRLGEHGAGVGRGARHSERHGRQTGPRRHGDASAGSGHADALSAVRVLP